MPTSGLLDEAVLDAAAKIWNFPSEKEKIPVWLDCDTGHDDAFAILLCATWPGFNLLGISTVHGNSSLPNTTSNTLSVLEAIGRRDVPVYEGAAKPFCRAAAHAESIHGITGLDGTTVLPQPVAKPRTHAHGTIAAMYEALSAHPGSACLVSTGSLTNIGLLFATHPDLSSSINTLSIMGGAIGGFFTNAPMGRLAERPDLELTGNIYEHFPEGLPDEDVMSLMDVAKVLKDAGIFAATDEVNDESILLFLEQSRSRFGNWSPFAEFNIYCDPEAASSIFSNRELASKTTLIPLDLTHQVLATSDVLHLLLYGHVAESPGTSTDKVTTPRLLFHEIITFFAATYASEFSMHEGPPLHDPLAIAAIMAPSLFDDRTSERFAVSVVRIGEEDDDGAGQMRRKGGDVGQCGRTVARLLKKGEVGVRIPRSLEVDVFWRMVNMAMEMVDATLK